MTAAPETPGGELSGPAGDRTADHPATTRLTGRLALRLDALVGEMAKDRRPATHPLEVGADVLGARLQERFGSCARTDLPDAGWREQLSFGDGQFDLVVCVGVLERLRDPDAVLRELARVTSRHLLLAVPHEPFSRCSNLLTGRHLRDLGATPGHRNRWTGAGFQRFVSQVGNVRAVASPFPWTAVWATKA